MRSPPTANVSIRLKLLLCLASTGVNSPLNAMFEHTKTRIPTVSPSLRDLSCEFSDADGKSAAVHLCFQIKDSEHLHAIERDGIFLIHDADVAETERFGQRLDDFVVRNRFMG